MPMRSIPRLLLLLVLFQAAWPGPAGAQSSGTPPPLPGVCSESDRFGVWHPRDGIETYDVGRLHLGWYTTFTVDANPSHPAGLNFVQLIRLSDDGPLPDAACSRCPTWNELRTIARLNPGSLWMVGNEPDRQDYLGAPRYAQLYHDLYTFLKAEDPTCQVAIGGVVQPTRTPTVTPGPQRPRAFLPMIVK